MAKILLWVLIIGVVGAGGYAVVKNDKAKEQVPAATEQSDTDTVTPASGKKMSFSAFINYDKGAYRCTVDQYLNEMDSDGVVYLENGKMRGDFATVAEGRKIKSSFIIKDGYQYFWSDAAPMGMKMAVQPGATGSASAQAQGTYSWSADQIGEYDCQPWVTKENHEARFALPSGVTFTDLSTGKQ